MDSISSDKIRSRALFHKIGRLRTLGVKITEIQIKNGGERGEKKVEAAIIILIYF